MKQLAPQLIIIRGPVGAGKTSVVEEIRRQAEHVSLVDFDVFKRQIDNSHSSDWRREMALKTALFMTQQLMAKNRVIAVDIHASRIDQLNAYISLAKENNYTITSFLLYPPLDTCLQRARERDVPDINYPIDDAMVTSYWNETIFINNEKIFDNPSLSPQEITREILMQLH